MIDNSTFLERTVAFFTLGCKLNFSETSTIAKNLTDEGFIRVEADQKADIYVINTCSVTEIADKKCRQVIKKAITLNPNAFVVVTGCYAQLKPDNIAKMPGVDLVLGSNEKFQIGDYLHNIEKRSQGEVYAGRVSSGVKFYPSYSMGDRTRCFLKVQDGCDYFCSYCTIPFARGHSRSDTIAKTVELAQEAVANGAKEIILTGVNIGDFGKTTGETFFDLVKALDKDVEISRIRISSIEPNLLTDEIIEFVASSKKILPHFHIPLQSGSDNILQIMQRRYDTALFRRRVDKIRSVLPNAFIGVDVIVGVRGESESDFEDTCNFIDSLAISQLHVFTYSERPNTRAIKMDLAVPIEIRKHRSQVLHQLSDKKTRQFYAQFVGRKGVALIEGAESGGKMSGYTENYLQVELPYNPALINTTIELSLGKLTKSGDCFVIEN